MIGDHFSNPTFARTITVPDVVSVRKLDWANSGHNDAFASDGVFVSFQDIAFNGFDYRPWALGIIENELPDLPAHGAMDADVTVNYVYAVPFAMETTVNFRNLP